MRFFEETIARVYEELSTLSKRNPLHDSSDMGLHVPIGDVQVQVRVQINVK